MLTDTKQKFMTKTFAYTLGVIFLSFVTAVFGAHHFPAVARMGWIGTIVLTIAWFIVIYGTQVIAPKSTILGQIGLCLVGIIAGLFMVSIFVYVPMIFILQALISSILLFLMLIFVGLLTPFDLSRLSTILYTTLFVIIIVSLVNVFIFHSSLLSLVISIVSVIIFSIFTARDAQYLNKLSNAINDSNMDGLAINGAMQLFLDFYNIFLSILNIILEMQRD